MLNQIVQAQISHSQAAAKQEMVTAKEIKEAMFSIASEKAPVPNGLSSHFFNKVWPIIQFDVIEAIKDFFTNGKLLGEVNATIIILVPKVQNPATMGQFRHLML